MDKQISAGCVLAYSVWATSIGLWGLAWLIDSDEIGRLSIIVCGIAATATIRSYFVAHEERLKNALAITAAVREESVTPFRGPR